MRQRSRLALIGSFLAVASLVLAACGSSPSGKSSGTGGATTPTGNAGSAIGEHNKLPALGSGKPVYGGTLTIVGSGDIDKLDTCCAYYTVTYEILRALSRQLVSYKTTATDPNPTTPVPDLASSYSVSPNGLTYTFHLRSGIYWDEPTGKLPVTAQDEVLGLKRLCNPVSPAPPLAYWENNIAGMQSYCSGFQAIKVPTSPSAQVKALKNYIDSHNISGVSAPNSTTVVIKLMKPNSSFINIMAMPMSSPVPPTILQWVPGSIQEEQHFISDGPYTLASFGPGGYNPGVSFHLVRNPYWSQATDPLRHQYFNAITVTEGENPTTVQQQLETGSADLEWDTTVPAASVEQLSSSPQYLAVFAGGIEYLVFNMKSTADGGALQKPAVRIALQYCMDKRHMIQVSGGPGVNAAANQILAPQITGFKQYNTYATPGNAGEPSKCKSMLAKAGYPHGLTLTLVYANNPPMPAQAAALQSDFAKAGVTIKFNEQPSQGEYFNYLETPSNKAHWDMAFGLWVPDWMGNSADSFFSPLLDGRLYTTGSTNYGDYNDPVVNAGIDKALHAVSLSQAASDWAALDKYAMTKNPPWIPMLYQALPQFIGKNVVHAMYNGDLGYVDITNLWVKK
ncbi:MAG TPA: ABC transporter substrate-binding protein [Acidimicrobiales bacterium]|nr:ABC transporter substrate-binding protein [Acidimicrobiales bacterium]